MMFRLPPLLALPRRRTVQRGGRPAEDRLEERVTVRDHLGRLHSARVSIYEAGKLRTEAAALYLPAGLAGKAVSGTAAASLAVGAAGAAAMAGALGALGGGGGSSDAAGAGAVGYWHGPDGQVTFGVLKDPAALGLPRQQPVTRAALERAPLPPWQQQPLVAPPKARQQQQQQPPTANGKAAGPRSKSREP